MSKSIFVDTLEINKEIVETFIVQASAIRESRTGSKFAALTLADRTGKVNAKAWDWKEATVPAVGTYVKVKGRVEKYKEQLQIVVLKIREATPEEVALEDYLPASEFDRDQLLGKVLVWAAGIEDPELNATVNAIVMSCATKLRNAPAAKGMHQAYLGGLCEHIIQLCRMADAVYTVYGNVNRDILIAACILHDIGKVDELCYETHIGNTVRGRLVGHITMGLQMFAEHRTDKATKDNQLLNHLEHIIASHHGKLEWGSPTVPMTREAIVFHQLDMIDSRMAGLDNAEKDPSRDAEGFVTARTFDGGWAWFPPQESK